MKLVVHIGSHKTGSTSVQQFCARHPDVLLAHAIHYPTGAFADYPSQHSALKDLIIADRMDEVRAFLTRAAADARASGATTVFLSGEDLCVLGPGLAHRFQSAAATIFDHTGIVLVLRNKRDYLLSAYKHNLLHANIAGEHDFIAGQVFSPRRSANAWAGLKGVTLRLLSFDAMQHDLLPSFFEQVFGFRVQANLAANASLDYLTLQVVNALLKNEPRAIQQAMRVNARHPPAPHLPIEAAIADSLARQYPDEDWDMAGWDFPGPSLTQPPPRPTGPEDAASRAALCHKMADLFATLETYFEQKQQKHPA